MPTVGRLTLLGLLDWMKMAFAISRPSGFAAATGAEFVAFLLVSKSFFVSVDLALVRGTHAEFKNSALLLGVAAGGSSLFLYFPLGLFHSVRKIRSASRGRIAPFY